MTDSATHAGPSFNHSSQDNGQPDDPYQPPQDETAAAALSWLQRALAVAIGLIVTLSSVATLTAFLFGLVVALGGQNQPGAVDPWQTVADGTGLSLFLAGAGLTVALSLFLGFFAWMKILAVWQRQQLHNQRRRELQDAVGQYRRAKQEADSAGVNAELTNKS